MPRGHKSKHRAQEKRHQVQGATQKVMGAQATAAAEEESGSSSPDSSQVPAESSPSSGSSSTLQGPKSIPSTTISGAAASGARAKEGTRYQRKEGSSSGRGKASNELQKRPLDKKVVVLVHYLLYKYQVKEPVTRADMLRNVIQMYKKQFPDILRRASDHLELIFGLDLKEVDPNRHTYILINKLESSYSSKMSNDIGVPTTGLLMTVLGVIFASGNRATEEQVWEVLNMMGLHAGRHHFLFGEPKKVLTKDLVKQNYLVYQQVPNSIPPTFEFLWGPRAYAETTKMKVLEFLAKVHDTTPSAFPYCHEEALRDEEERSRARNEARAHTSAFASVHSSAARSSSSDPK